MNVQIFIRNVQLAKLGIAVLDNKEQKVYDFLVDNLTELCVYTPDKKPDMLYFGKSTNIIVLFYNSEYETLYVDSYKIWPFFENDLSMETRDIQSLIKWWVSVGLDLKPKYVSHSFKEFAFMLVLDCI